MTTRQLSTNAAAASALFPLSTTHYKLHTLYNTTIPRDSTRGSASRRHLNSFSTPKTTNHHYALPVWLPPLVRDARPASASDVLSWVCVRQHVRRHEASIPYLWLSPWPHEDKKITALTYFFYFPAMPEPQLPGLLLALPLVPPRVPPRVPYPALLPGLSRVLPPEREPLLEPTLPTTCGPWP